MKVIIRMEDFWTRPMRRWLDYWARKVGCSLVPFTSGYMYGFGKTHRWTVDLDRDPGNRIRCGEPIGIAPFGYIPRPPRNKEVK